MSFLLKIHSLVAKSAAKVMPKARERILTLVNCLKTLASEHVNLLCREICLKTKHKLISFALYVMYTNSDVFRAHRCWYIVPFLNKYYLCLFTVCKTLPFLSIIYNDNSFLLAAMTEKPGSELQK